MKSRLSVHIDSPILVGVLLAVARIASSILLILLALIAATVLLVLLIGCHVLSSTLRLGSSLSTLKIKTKFLELATLVYTKMSFNLLWQLRSAFQSLPLLRIFLTSDSSLPTRRCSLVWLLLVLLALLRQHRLRVEREHGLVERMTVFVENRKHSIDRWTRHESIFT
jgi:hypothetical protein